MIKVGDRVAVYQEKMKRKGVVSAIFNKDMVNVIIQYSPSVIACVHIKQCRKLKPKEKSIKITLSKVKEAYKENNLDFSGKACMDFWKKLGLKCDG